MDVPKENNLIMETRTVKLKSVNMQPVKPKMDMQLQKPIMNSNNKKLVGLAKDKNCQATVKMCSDKKCQENINMQSVTNTNDMQLPKPAVPYEYRRLCKDKNCQSTRCYKSPVRPMYNYD